jgi:hypothetical protein
MRRLRGGKANLDDPEQQIAVSGPYWFVCWSPGIHRDFAFFQQSAFSTVSRQNEPLDTISIRQRFGICPVILALVPKMVRNL